MIGIIVLQKKFISILRTYRHPAGFLSWESCNRTSADTFCYDRSIGRIRTMKRTASYIITAMGALAAVGALTGLSLLYPPVPKEKKGKKHIVCIGDSITFGAGVQPLQNLKSYPAYLQKLLGDDYQVMNFGLNGRTLLSTGDVPYTREKYFPKTFGITDAYYLIMLGTNDSKPYNWNAEMYEKELEALIRKYPEGRVTIMKMPYAFAMEGQHAVAFNIREEQIQEANRIIDYTAVKLHVPVVDLHAYTEGHKEWYKDGVHPNAAGNQMIAEHIFEHLQDLDI